MPKIIAAAVVRMGSSRLPGKTLMNIAGKPLLGHLLDRLKQCETLDGIVVATTIKEADDAIADYCQVHNMPCFRGSEDDVLERMVGAYQMLGAEIGVEAFGDGPLIDPAVVDRIVNAYLDADGAYHLVGNDMKTTYPPGMDVEAFDIDALEDADRRATDPAIREHGTGYIRQNPDIYRLLNLEASGAERRPDLTIEVDTAEDVEIVSAVIEHFHPRNDYSLAEIISFLDANPDIATLNQNVHRRWKE
jgi:spore coat polysaccharide biosynthesis protein SpsF